MAVHSSRRALLLLVLAARHCQAVRIESGELAHEELLQRSNEDLLLSERGFVPCGDLEEYGIKIGLVIDSYTLGACLGGGSFGEAWTAQHSVQEDAGAGGAVVLKILKTQHGQVDFRGQRADENLLKECLYAQAMKERDPEHFVNCAGVGSFMTTHSTAQGSEPVQLMYAATELVGGHNLQEVLLESMDAPSDIPKLKDVMALAKELMAAFDPTVQGDMKFYHNDLQPSNLMFRKEDGGPKVTVLDYGEADICCAKSEMDCTLGSAEMRQKLQVSYGETLDVCSKQKPKSDTNIGTHGLMETGRLLALNVLLTLCKPASAWSPPFSLVQQMTGDQANEFVEQVSQSLRDAYAAELNEETRGLLQAVIRSLYLELAGTYASGTWPWQDFSQKLEALQAKLA